MAKPRTRELPTIPAVFLEPERATAIFFGQMKKKLQRQFGGMYSEVRDEIRKELGLSEEEARIAALYVVQMSRVAMLELFDEIEQRLQKQ